ncbi:MAG: MBOAT family protein [Clostridia bacterium]|nr:MBOAT family protein [Clostridia bacterium]
MVFSEPVFMFIFLPVSLLLYYAVPFRFKNAVLFLTGLLFYAWGEPVYVLIMILSTFIDYVAGRVMDRFDTNNKIRKIALIVSVVMNLSLLGVFKYSGFLIDSLNSVFGITLYNPKLPLPIGISFFTFQSMSYTIDLYRRNISVQKNFINFAAFVTMFPQIVAGPIVRYDDVAKELDGRKIDFESISNGISIFICGLCKKVLIANSVGELWTTVKETDYSSMPAAAAWLGIIAFTLQIYFDFSGYSDMAIGLGKMLGFNFPQNFDYPYTSKTVSEFWRKWHMTLGGWFKSYVYFPLGGSRNGKLKTIRNLLIVWFLTGLWHGASWNFVIWGIYYGILLILEKFVFAKIIEKLPAALTRIYTLFAIVIGWVIFEITSPSDGFEFISSMFGASGAFSDTFTLNMLHNYAITIIAAAIIATGIPMKICKKLFSNQKLDFICIGGEIIGLTACIAYLVDASYNPFLYFNF